MMNILGLLRSIVVTISSITIHVKERGGGQRRETNLIIDDGFRIIKDKISIIAVSKTEEGN